MGSGSGAAEGFPQGGGHTLGAGVGSSKPPNPKELAAARAAKFAAVGGQLTLNLNLKLRSS